MARGKDLRKPSLGEYTAPSRKCLSVSARSIALFKRISDSSGKGLNLITNDENLTFKYDGN